MSVKVNCLPQTYPDSAGANAAYGWMHVYLTKSNTGNVEWLDKVAQERPLHSGDGPAGQLVTVSHAADSGCPHTDRHQRRRHQGAFGKAV